MSLPYTQHELDDMQCGRRGCDHTDCTELYLHSACHTAVPTWCRYDKAKGTIIVLCAQCKRVVAEIQVAP